MKLTGPWSEDEAWAFARRTVIPAKLACQTPSGWPTTASMWFLVEDGAFWCATPRSAHLAGWLERDPRCAIEIAPEQPPYRGIRARARAHLLPDPDRRVLRKLIERYLGDPDSRLAQWLLQRDVEECAIQLTPTRISSWDFTARMSGASPEPAGLAEADPQP